MHSHIWLWGKHLLNKTFQRSIFSIWQLKNVLFVMSACLQYLPVYNTRPCIIHTLVFNQIFQKKKLHSKMYSRLTYSFPTQAMQLSCHGLPVWAKAYFPSSLYFFTTTWLNIPRLQILIQQHSFHFALQTG